MSVDWLTITPDAAGNFDEVFARFSNGEVHVETLSDQSVYIGFYNDDGEQLQLWISAKKKLRYHHERAKRPLAASGAGVRGAQHWRNDASEQSQIIGRMRRGGM